MTGLAAEGLVVSLGGQRVLDGVDFTAPAAAITGLVGPNGAGKTTLLRALLGLVSVEAGRVEAAGEDITARPVHNRSGLMSYLPQGGVVHWPITVERLVTLGRLPHQEHRARLSDSDRAAIMRAMADADVAHLGERPATSLSGGERMRAMLARVLAADAPFLLADEPVAALDPLHALSVMNVFRRLAASGRTVVVVLHDLALASRFCDHVVLIDRARVVASGPPAEVLNPERLAEVYGVRARGDLSAASFDFA